MRKQTTYLMLAVSIAFASCNQQETKKEKVLNSGFENQNFDSAIRPQDDLNLHVNGGWLANNPVPESETRWGSFNEVLDRNREFLKKILNESVVTAPTAKKGSNTQKLGDFYATAMDSIKLNAEGVTPLKEYIELIDNLKSKEELPVLIAKLNKIGVGGFYGFYVYVDAKKSDEMICYLSQGGTSLPDVDYYINERYADIRTQYENHIANMLQFMNMENSKDLAKKVMILETNLAKNSMSRLERRNPDSTYFKFKREELKKICPSFDFETLFKEKGLPDFNEIVISQPKFIQYFNTSLNESSLETIQAYLKWNLINSYSDYLSDEIALESFNFYSKTLRGAKEQQPRWKKAIQTTDGRLGEILGQEYVKVAFSPEAKEKVFAMVDQIQEVYAERIKQLDWMSEETKIKALEKLSTFTKKLGYPDVWKDYSSLQIERDSYAKNIMRASEWSHNYNISKLGKPVDKEEWGMTPSTVNAYYSPLKNEIVFPAGIMQPPFFDVNADDAVNYGGIGAVIGHELSHGFDDQGSKYDAKGNLNSWWTDEDKAKFEEKTAQLAAQFDNYVVLDSLRVNGKLTLGENIADLGGITMAYHAYQKQLLKTGRKDIDGFTPEQRFFMGWAQVWRMNFTDKELATRLVTDVHSPGMFRANGAPSNLVEFYKAFDVKPEDKMFREEADRVLIW